MAKSALLVMDVTLQIRGRIPDEAGYLKRLHRAIGAAHAADIPVIYAIVAFRSGHPEIGTRNKSFRKIPSTLGLVEGDPNSEVHPDVAPEPGDVVITKKRVSAFAGSDLDIVLRAGDIDSLVLTGLATSGVVLSTLLQAADLDFGLTVLADGCLDGDPEVHRVLTEKVFPHQADVVTVDDWVTAIGK
jgi:nicotinamidase-related amidase